MTSSSENKCPKNVFCDFIPVIENEEVLKESCRNCGKTLIFNKVNGEVDPARYTNAHYRDLLQPFGSHHEDFMRVYGQASIDLMNTWIQTKKEQAQRADHIEFIKDKVKKKARVSSTHYF